MPPSAIASSIPATVPMPLDVRTALGLLAQMAGAETGRIEARVIGSPVLVDALAGYGAVTGAPWTIVALGADPDEVRGEIVRSSPSRVLTLVAGTLAAPLAPLRVAPIYLPADLPEATWRALGYRRVASIGVQGAGSLVWSIGERLMRAVNRPDLADRCRIAALSTLTACRLVPNLSTAIIRDYRRLP